MMELMDETIGYEAVSYRYDSFSRVIIYYSNREINKLKAVMRIVRESTRSSTVLNLGTLEGLVLLVRDLVTVQGR